MTVFENVAFGLRMKPLGERPSEREIQIKVQALLQLVQLEWLAQRFPAQLSGGQRQRIALARALAVEPRVLLLDEPFGALDAKVRKDLRRWLRKLHDELAVTSIFVTHDQEEALEVADRVVLMDHGRVEQVGTPEAVYQHPATPFVYGFLGSVNLFHGRVEGNAIRMGDSVVPQANLEIDHGAEVLAFARPHEVDIVLNDKPYDGIAARVQRVWSLGATTRVELDSVVPSGVQHYEVELTRERAEVLGLEPGQAVRLIPSSLRVFEREAFAGSTL